jgi:Mlc titration factor MtfA (ptsG expression regulator)
MFVYSPGRNGIRGGGHRRHDTVEHGKPHSCGVGISGCQNQFEGLGWKWERIRKRVAQLKRLFSDSEYTMYFVIFGFYGHMGGILIALFFLLIVLTFAILFFYFFVNILDYFIAELIGHPLRFPIRWKTKKVSLHQSSLLHHYFSFYRRLPPKRKIEFEHRVAHFLEVYEINGRDFTVTEDVRMLVSGTYVMLTFGFRDYLADVFERIIIYPEVYYSNITDQYHKGEFNPAMRAVVFSWADLLEGHSVDNDNLNLGIHEFTHVLHRNAHQERTTTASVFKRHYNNLMQFVKHPHIQRQIVESNYFRDYAFTNEYEFLAVVIEHYYETPLEFRSHFPNLFRKVSRMLNHAHTLQLPENRIQRR